MADYKKIVLLLLLFTGSLFTTFAAASTVEDKRISLIEYLIDNNLGYSEEVNIQEFLAWENDLTDYYLQKKDYERMFLVRKLAVYACGYNGEIVLALSKAKEILSQAEELNFTPGIAIGNMAIGDTYISADMKSEAIEVYETALKELEKSGNSAHLKVRVFTQLIPTLTQLKRMSEAKTHLDKLKSLYINEQNHFLPNILQAYYLIRIKEPQKASYYLKQAEICYKQYPHYFHYCMLTYIKADYLSKTGKLQEAIQLYNSLIKDESHVNYLKLKKTLSALYALAGDTKAACEVYKDINSVRDSINARNYSSQINMVRTVYQMDQLEINNQKKRNRILLFFILGSVFILSVIVFFVFRIRRVNKRLKNSKLLLEVARKNAENSIRTKSLFLSNMSHEIRTPLNALSGFSSILTDGNIDNDTRQQCYGIIQQNSDLLLKLINDVIDLSSLEIGKMQFRFGLHDAITLCRNVIDTVDKIKQTAANVSFESSLAELNLYTDETRLQQLLINLLINATKFTAQGSIRLTLELQSDGTALFAVTDTGCGIAPEMQKAIFNRFEKLNENAQGSGLGLSICQLIIEHFGGRIWIDSAYKEGSRFLFTHPVSTEHTREENIV